MIMPLSAVKIRFGLMFESTIKEPLMKSALLIGMEKGSAGLFLLVIWQSITSSPGRSANTSAGLRFEADKSEKGNGITTISPFTNPAILHLLLSYSNLSPIPFHSQNESRSNYPPHGGAKHGARAGVVPLWKADQRHQATEQKRFG